MQRCKRSSSPHVAFLYMNVTFVVVGAFSIGFDYQCQFEDYKVHNHSNPWADIVIGELSASLEDEGNGGCAIGQGGQGSPRRSSRNRDRTYMRDRNMGHHASRRGMPCESTRSGRQLGWAAQGRQLKGSTGRRR